MIQFATPPVLLISSDARSSSISCRILIMQEPTFLVLKHRSYNDETNMQVPDKIFNSPELYHMHQHARISQNFVMYMQCSAVLIFIAFESNHAADTSLPSF